MVAGLSGNTGHIPDCPECCKHGLGLIPGCPGTYLVLSERFGPVPVLPRASFGSRGADAPFPVVVFVHGESYEWNAGSPYDGSVLASWGHVIAITFNYRLGILGFLRTRLGSQDLDFGTGDIVTLLRWVQDNAAAFGGDPKRVTVLGHDTGAALASTLLLSPLSRGLFQHVVLMSGTVLSPWATVQNPWDLRATVSHQLGCHVSAPGDQDLAPCLRRLPLEALLFLPRFGPSIPLPGLEPARVALEKATDPFVRCPLLLGVHTTESYDDFNNQDIQYGFEEEQRNRVLRTFVRNAYVFHLNEIFSTVRNEYTDWEKPVAHPINLRDNTLEALSDGHTVAPLVQLARAHARRGAPTYLFHFAHQTRDSLYPQRLGSVRGEGLPYLLGLPLVAGEPHFPHNYSRQDVAVAEATINYLCNFARTG
ncbi:Neuroligin-1 [Frankliniella fusca]|uniref:Neuroligin-1 n=1 Tax=Frankliniella fusca TaxID=407009 RepID=A0AAE1LLU2_9NEOP|nr:Neuroligin-1 [Frankliniella fusca]